MSEGKLTKEQALEKFKEAAREGNVEIGNAAFKQAAGSGKEVTAVAWFTPNGLGFDFSIRGVGFGQIFLTLSKDAKAVDESGIPQGRLFIDSECMSRDTVKAILCQAVDDATMDWEELEHAVPEGKA